MEKRIVLEGEGIATGYRQGKQLTEVHQGLDFSLSGGELACLLGCNGAGKSTLLRTLAGMQPSVVWCSWDGLWVFIPHMSVPKS